MTDHPKHAHDTMPLNDALVAIEGSVRMTPRQTPGSLPSWRLVENLMANLYGEAWEQMAWGCPDRHAKARPVRGQCPEWDRWHDRCLSLLGTGSLIVLCGSRGSGKTQLAVELIRHQKYRCRPTRYVTAMDLFLAVRNSYQSENETETSVLKPYIETALLVIDEIHERGQSEWEDRLLRYVIDKRYGSMRDTVVIGNLRPDALWEALGKSARSRFEEIGTLIECNGVNWRKREVES